MSEEEHRQKVDELTQSILKNNLLAAENTEKLVENYGGDGVTEAFIENAKKMLDNTDDPQRAHKICSITVMIGQRLGDERVAQWAQKKLQEWQGKHAPNQPENNA